MTMGVFHLPKNSGNSGRDVNGTQLFGWSHWKISGKSGTSEKVVRCPGGNFPMEICVPFTEFLVFIMPLSMPSQSF